MKITGNKNYWIFKIDHQICIHNIRIFGIYEDDWIKIEPDGWITIKATKKRPYAWDGCTPKFAFLDIVFGTPDGIVNPLTGKPKTYLASMFHDALYQFAPRDLVTRKQVDLMMLDEMKRNKFKLAKLYYLGIRAFGWIYW